VVHDTDTGEAKSDEQRWMRLTLDTVGKLKWPEDRQGRPIYPEHFEELAKKLERPLHPPGRDVRCIVSVGMLTEGWDCNTVTYIIGLRPFMSQLLCEQVVGRGLRRQNYEDFDEKGMLREEVAKVFGVPFEVIPFKANPTGPGTPRPKRYHIHAIPQKAQFEIRFPRIEGYTQAIRNRVAVDWSRVPSVVIDPMKIPPTVEVKGLNVSKEGRLTLSGPGPSVELTLAEFRAKSRLQALVFELARTLTRDYLASSRCDVPAHVLFPQLAAIVDRYVRTKVQVFPPADLKDIFLSPYYGWLVERLVEEIHADTSQGEVPEVPRYEAHRRPGSTAEVDLWTSRDVREITKSHLNFVVADTAKWVQAAAYHIDKHPSVVAFVKNAGLGFAIPYFHNGQMHDYVPDFIIQLDGESRRYLILEVKGYDPLEEVKRAAAKRWVAAVNADGTHGVWHFAMAKRVSEVNALIAAAASGRPS
jgi:type III restriction enzyme